MLLMGELVDWTQLRKNLSLNIYQQKPPKFKSKEKKTEKIEQNIQGLWESYKRCNIYVMRIPEGEASEKETE